MRKPKFYYYNKEICKETSNLCTNRRDFYIRFNSAYNAAEKHGWLDEFLPKLIKEKNYWTYEKCKEESLKYDTKKQFKQNNETVYKKILKNKWDNELFKHMIILGNLKKRLIYAQEFPDKSVYIGLTGNIKKRSKNHVTLKKETVFKYIKKTGFLPKLKLLTYYIPINDAIKKENEFVEKYKKENWNVLNLIKTGGIGKIKTKWDVETVLNEALKYNSKSEFKLNSYNAYCVMYKLKCQNLVCSHMLETNKKVLQLTLYGQIINEYESVNAAHKKTGVRYSTILSCCNKKYKTGGGFIWSYVKY